MKRLAGLLRNDRCREDLRQFAWFGLGYAVVLLLGYLVLRQINLTLSATEMGRFSYVAGLVGVVMPLLYIAAPQAYLRFQDNHAVSPRLRRMLLPLFAVSAVGVAGIVWWRTSSVLALVYAAFPFFNERLFVFRSQMRTGAVNVMKAVELAVPLVGLLVLPSFGGAVDAATVLALYGIGYLLAFGFPLRLKETESVPGRGMLVRFLVPVAVTMLVGTLIENLTVIMAESLIGYEAAAQMGVAARNLIFIKALFSLLQMFYPVLYFREMQAGRYGIARIYRLTILLLALSAVGVMIAFAPLLYRITGAAAYVGTRHVFVLLAAAFAFDFVFETYGLYFQFEVKTWKATVVKSVFLLMLLAGYAVLRFASVVPRDRYLSAIAWLVFSASLTSATLGTVWSVLAEKSKCAA